MRIQKFANGGSGLSLTRRSWPPPPEVIFEYCVKRIHAVLPIDFFAFGIRPAAVRNSYLIYPAILAGELRDHLRLNTKTIFFDLNRFDKSSPERFIAGFHVRQIEVGKHVGKQGQKPVSGHVPEKKNPMWSAAREPRAEDHIRLAR